MARRPRVFAPGLLYHVIARGNQRQKTFLNHADYQAYLERLSRYRKRYGYYEVEDQRFLGSEGFGEKLRKQDEPRAAKRRALEPVIKALGAKLGIGAGELKSADRSWAVSRARTMIGYVLVRRAGYRLGEVAKYFGRDPATVGTLLGRLAARIDEEEELRREIERLSKIVTI